MINCCKYLSVFALVALLSVSGLAQSSTGSAYNIFGVGRLSDFGLGSYKSMGNAAIGARSSSLVNLKNPAAFNAVSGPTQVFDVEVAMSSFSQATSEEHFQSMLGGLRNLNLYFKTNKGGGLIIGMNQFSNTRYDITDNNGYQILTSKYSVRYQGTGGLSRMYLGFGQRINPYVSLGARGSLLFGQMGQVQTLGNNALLNGIVLEDETTVAQVIADFGAQFNIPIAEKNALTVGLIYRPKFGVDGTITSKVIQDESDSITTTSSTHMIIPAQYGVGLSYRTKAWMLSLDMEMEQWSVNESTNDLDYLDKYKVSFGAEYVRDRWSTDYIDRVSWRWGASVNNYYLKIDGNTFPQVKASFGIGLPTQTGSGAINIGYEYESLGTKQEGLIFESTHTISLNVSFADLWFVKRKYD